MIIAECSQSQEYKYTRLNLDQSRQRIAGCRLSAGLGVLRLCC